MSVLNEWGWDAFFEAQLGPDEAKDAAPARVLEQHRTEYVLMAPAGEVRAELTGRFRQEIAGGAEAPVVGDWVLAEVRAAERRAAIRRLLVRRTGFSRKAAGVEREQVVAANIDYALLVAALDHDFNLRRLERYVTMAWESGAQPVVVLTKADLCEDVPARIARAQDAARGVAVHAVSVVWNMGLGALAPFLAAGKTAVLLGSSGAGKSTLVNRLLGEARQKVNTVGDDDSGKHTTTSRQLIRLPDGGMLIDTPGMRELGLWRDPGGEGLERTFQDLSELAAQCRFNDCSHVNEPGCAVRAALERGELSPARLESFRKLERELAFERRKSDKVEASNAKKRWKKIQVQVHDLYKHRRREGRSG